MDFFSDKQEPVERPLLGIWVGETLSLYLGEVL